MLHLKDQINIDRCPECSVDQPNMYSTTNFTTTSFDGGHPRFWRVYRCQRCGGCILACSKEKEGVIVRMFPVCDEVDESIPETAKEYLKQAINSLHAPAGSVMFAASAVDAMLKAKGYEKGNLSSRINQAKEAHLITEEMALWAHEVRLDANDPRHADETSPLLNDKDARQYVDFVIALGQFLFVLPARVERGRADATN